jgi:hypothetical protein
MVFPMNGKRDDQYSEQETQRRFEGMLRASRKVGHKTLKSMTPKRAKKQRVKRKSREVKP